MIRHWSGINFPLRPPSSRIKFYPTICESILPYIQGEAGSSLRNNSRTFANPTSKEPAAGLVRASLASKHGVNGPVGI